MLSAPSEFLKISSVSCRYVNWLSCFVSKFELAFLCCETPALVISFVASCLTLFSVKESIVLLLRALAGIGNALPEGYGTNRRLKHYKKLLIHSELFSQAGILIIASPFNGTYKQLIG